MRRTLASWLLLATVLAAAPAGATPQWGWLGVRIRDLSEQEMNEISTKYGLREGFGAMIVEVLKETPAEAAGLRSGDIVVALRDRPIVDTRQLQRHIASAGVGSTVPMTVLRRDEGRRPVSVRIGVMPDPVVAERVAAEYGFFVREPEVRLDPGGVRPPASPSVAGIVPKSRAAAAGLRAGDVLLEVNGRPVGTLSAVKEALVSVAPDGPLSLVVSRDRERLTVSLERVKSP